jgi:hypothetical protein
MSTRPGLNIVPGLESREIPVESGTLLLKTTCTAAVLKVRYTRSPSPRPRSSNLLRIRTETTGSPISTVILVTMPLFEIQVMISDKYGKNEACGDGDTLEPFTAGTPKDRFSPVS